jgi:hypothetical protein
LIAADDFNLKEFFSKAYNTVRPHFAKAAHAVGRAYGVPEELLTYVTGRPIREDNTISSSEYNTTNNYFARNNGSYSYDGVNN